MSKFGFKHYFAPTPKRIRIFGDSLLAASVFLAGLSVVSEHPTMAIVVSTVGALGKFISNFFTDDETQN